MDETLRQLGELLLRAIPTVICFLLAYTAYRFLVHKPLVRVLEERHARTEGAVEKARADIAAAAARTAEYEQRVREAKVAIYKAQEARRQQALAARAAALAEAREGAAQQVSQARAILQQEMEAAKTGLQSEVDRLAAEVIRTVLKPAVVAQARVGGGQ